MKSWQIYDRARKSLRNEMYEIYGNRSSRMIDYWAQDPDFSAETKRNPIDRLEELLRRLCEADERDAAKAALRILAHATNCYIRDRSDIHPDKETLAEEIIDDLPRLVDYHQALLGTDLEEVDRARAALERELTETRMKFIEVNNIRVSKFE
jgi:hypothetical protein